jgi:ABC-type multidrug transport system ATPase subunit
MPMSTVISIWGLVKRFGRTRALDGLELEVCSGEVQGFLGPNGAGKTTTLWVLLGLLRADAGRVELLGGDPWRDAVALIAALAADVELLLLDEPTAGRDPLLEAAFREVVAGEGHGGRTVLLSSHILSEVEALCERVSIIWAGRVVESGTLAELRYLTRTSISAELAGPLTGWSSWPACTTWSWTGPGSSFRSTPPGWTRPWPASARPAGAA